MIIRQADASEAVQMILILGQPQYEFPGSLKKVYPHEIKLGPDVCKAIQALTRRIEEHDRSVRKANDDTAIKDEQDAVPVVVPGGAKDLPGIENTGGGPGTGL